MPKFLGEACIKIAVYRPTMYRRSAKRTKR